MQTCLQTKHTHARTRARTHTRARARASLMVTHLDKQAEAATGPQVCALRQNHKHMGIAHTHTVSPIPSLPTITSVVTTPSYLSIFLSLSLPPSPSERKRERERAREREREGGREGGREREREREREPKPLNRQTMAFHSLACWRADGLNPFPMAVQKAPCLPRGLRHTVLVSAP